MDEWFTLNFDGGSRGNPGPAGLGAVVYAADGTPLITVGKFIGRATNNVAEYKGLIVALEQALVLGATKVIVRGDSELIIKQMRGEYRVKHPDMKPLHEKAQLLLKQFDQYKIEHNLRGKNALADKLANLAMDRRGDVTDEDGTVADGPVAGGNVSPPMVAASKTPQRTLTNAPAPRAGNRWQCEFCGCLVEMIAMSNVGAGSQQALVCVCGKKMKRL